MSKDLLDSIQLYYEPSVLAKLTLKQKMRLMLRRNLAK